MLSSDNARLASARRLTSRKHRRETGRFLAEGMQAVREALRRPEMVVEAFATADALERHLPLLDQARAGGVRVDEISPRAAAALSETVTPQGLVAVCHAVDVSLRAAFSHTPRLVVVLVDTNDPGNVGTILRTADAAGAGAVVLAGGVDVYNGKTVRASAGSLFHLDVVLDADLGDALAAAAEARMTTLATTGAGAHDLDTLAADGVLGGPSLWLFGNEAHGLPQDAIDAADYSVRVPIYGRAESLSVGAAAAVCLYTAARARGVSSPLPTTRAPSRALPRTSGSA